jgi:biotin carboxylase
LGKKTLKKILILNGSFCEEPVIKKAKEMGYYVVTTGNAPELSGHKSADVYIPCDYSDKEAVLELVKANNIEGIVSCANDFGVLTAAYVAEQMGWKGHDTYKNALLLHHKDLFKQYCSENNIPSVLSSVFTDEQTLLQYVKTCHYPIIVKANDLTGGKGIQRANTYEEAVCAARYAFEMSRDKRVLVEPFIEGTQHAIDAFIVGGEIVCTTGCNCYSVVNPYLIQTETYPSDYLEQDREEICDIIRNMVHKLGLVDGVFTVQYMRKEGKIYVIEVMRRLTGNLSFTLYEKITGFPWYEGYIRAELGLDCVNLFAKETPVKYCGHHGIFARQNGILKSYTIPDDVKTHMYEFVELIKPGETIHNYKLERIASIFYTYQNKAEMDEAASEFCDRIVVEMDETGDLNE